MTRRAPLRQPDRHPAARRAADPGRARHDAGHRHRRHRPVGRLGGRDHRRRRLPATSASSRDQNSRRRRAASRSRSALGAVAGARRCGTASWSPVIGIQPIIATLILMVAGRGLAQLITDGPDHHDQQRAVQADRRRLLADPAVRDLHRAGGGRARPRCSPGAPRSACSSSRSAATPRPAGWPASGRGGSSSWSTSFSALCAGIAGLHDQRPTSPAPTATTPACGSSSTRSSPWSSAARRWPAAGSPSAAPSSAR